MPGERNKGRQASPRNRPENLHRLRNLCGGVPDGSDCAGKTGFDATEKIGANMKNQTNLTNADENTADLSLLARLLDEDNDENIFLFDESGKEVELEQVATILYEENIYAIMHPLDAEEDEAVVFLIDQTDEESIRVVEDETLAEKILELYHERAGV